MEQEIDRFDAVSEDGTVYTIVEYQRVVGFRPISRQSPDVGGSRRLALVDGRHVNQIDENTFRIFDDETIIRRT
jgi:hypothetical protein